MLLPDGPGSLSDLSDRVIQHDILSLPLRFQHVPPRIDGLRLVRVVHEIVLPEGDRHAVHLVSVVEGLQRLQDLRVDVLVVGNLADVDGLEELVLDELVDLRLDRRHDVVLVPSLQLGEDLVVARDEGGIDGDPVLLLEGLELVGELVALPAQQPNGASRLRDRASRGSLLAASRPKGQDTDEGQADKQGNENESFFAHRFLLLRDNDMIRVKVRPHLLSNLSALPLCSSHLLSAVNGGFGS